MSEIYLPKLIDKISDFVPGLKANWQDYETHKAATPESENVHGLQDMIQTLTALFGAEYGKNANGEWVRFNFGLQICWIVKPSWPGAVADTAWGNTYRSSTQFTWSYPKNFIDNPFLAGGGSGSVSVVCSGSTGRSNTESMVFRTERANASAIDPDIWLVAIGWWKEPDIEGYEPVE